MLAWYYVTGQEFFSSLCSPQGHRAFITESRNCFSHVSMDTIIDSSIRRKNLTLVWCIWPIAHLLSYFFQQPALLNLRIWVIWITKGLLDTGAPSGNTTQLDAQTMTWKVFCVFTCKAEPVCWFSWVQKHLQTFVIHPLRPCQNYISPVVGDVARICATKSLWSHIFPKEENAAERWMDLFLRFVLSVLVTVYYLPVEQVTGWVEGWRQQDTGSFKHLKSRNYATSYHPHLRRKHECMT